MDAPCCAVFSVFGIIFLCSVGLLLQKEPIYIQGPEDPAAAAVSCYKAAVLYAITLVISLLIIFFNRATSKPPTPPHLSAQSGQYGAVSTTKK